MFLCNPTKAEIKGRFLGRSRETDPGWHVIHLSDVALSPGRKKVVCWVLQQGECPARNLEVWMSLKEQRTTWHFWNTEIPMFCVLVKYGISLLVLLLAASYPVQYVTKEIYIWWGLWVPDVISLTLRCGTTFSAMKKWCSGMLRPPCCVVLDITWTCNYSHNMLYVDTSKSLLIKGNRNKQGLRSSNGGRFLSLSKGLWAHPWERMPRSIYSFCRPAAPPVPQQELVVHDKCRGWNIGLF